VPFEVHRRPLQPPLRKLRRIGGVEAKERPNDPRCNAGRCTSSQTLSRPQGGTDSTPTLRPRPVGGAFKGHIGETSFGVALSFAISARMRVTSMLYIHTLLMVSIERSRVA